MKNEAHAARREFLGASVAALGCISLTSCATTVGATQSEGQDVGQGASKGVVRPGNTVLFQGDSITDSNRDRGHAATANHQAGLGNGYAWLAAAGLLVRFDAAGPNTDNPATHNNATPGQGLSVLNRGISGHKVFQLADRWQQDCFDLQPDVISILIGVNDIWHAKNGNYDGTVAIYERDYDALLERTKATLPKTRMVICEPFVLRCGAVKDDWFPEFDEYRMAARRVATKHNATFVAFQSMFDRAVRFAPPEHWAKDGVHPSRDGAALMAHTWLATVG